MSDAINPAAPHHLPGFITAPGETDILFTGSVVFLIVLVLFMGSMYFWLHSMPERIAHGASKLQFQLVAVLSLLALFTHNNAFWVAALLLALVPIPDFWTPLATMAESLAKMAAPRLRNATAGEPPATVPGEVASISPPPPDVAAAALAASTEVDENRPPVPGTEGPAPSATRPDNQSALAKGA